VTSGLGSGIAVPPPLTGSLGWNGSRSALVLHSILKIEIIPKQGRLQ